METNLYFGQSKPDGGQVSAAEWNEFREKYIADVFKDGSTIVNATGNWLDTDSHQLITESTYVVTCFYKRSKMMSMRIDSLRNWYKTRFRQQSVLRIDRKVKASF